jgi:hypothetical protein
MNNMKLPALAGFFYVLIWILGLALEPSSPGLKSSSADLTAFYLTHQQVHLIQSYLIDGVAGIALLFFSAGCASYFHRIKNQDWTLPLVIFGSGVAASGVSLVQAAFQQVLSSNLLPPGDVSVHLILAIVNYLDTFKLLALFSLTGSVSLFIFQTRQILQWIGWLSLVVSILLFTGGLSLLVDQSILTSALFASLPLLLIWVAVMSVLIYRKDFNLAAER